MNRVTQINLEGLATASATVAGHDQGGGLSQVSQHNIHQQSEKRAQDTPSGSRTKVIARKPRDLVLSAVSKGKTKGVYGAAVRNESPWDTFRKVYECDLGGVVEVVSRRSGPRGVYSLRQLPGKDPQDILEWVGSIRHPNVASALEYFYAGGTAYAIGEFYPLTLGHIVASKAFPNESQISAIMFQVR